MVKEAELHAEEDKKEREKAEVRNEADTMIYSTEKNITDLGDKVNAADKSKAEEAIAELRQALEGGDVETIKAKTEALKQVSYKIAEEVYKQTGAQQQGPAPGGTAEGPGNPGGGDQGGGNNTNSAEDVDYEVVDDK
jgi:molecular chaperone DnaK